VCAIAAMPVVRLLLAGRGIPPPLMILRALSRVVDSDVALRRWPVCAPLTGGVRTRPPPLIRD
jgi:hypothetical protein